MAVLAILAFLTGAVLAFRFSVLVLYPIVALGATVGLIAGLGAGYDLWTITLGIGAGALTLQAGYAFGAVGRMSLVAARLSARRRNRSVGTLPTRAI